MTFNEFVEKHDKEGAIILLEGKREVLEADKAKLTALGRLLATHTRHMQFRSGNAEGADQLFSAGVAEIDHTRLHVITPYSTHRKKTNLAFESISLDDVNLAMEPEVVYQTKTNKKMAGLVDRLMKGEKSQYTTKVQYIIRDTVKVTGTRKIKPATFAIFYDDLKNPRQGGTGHTMEICKNKKVTAIDQRMWMKWLEEEQPLS
jgi:hypothetical protein